MVSSCCGLWWCWRWLQLNRGFAQLACLEQLLLLLLLGAELEHCVVVVQVEGDVVAFRFLPLSAWQVKLPSKTSLSTPVRATNLSHLLYCLS